WPSLAQLARGQADRIAGSPGAPAARNARTKRAMDFQFSEEQEMTRQMIRDFAEKEIRPHVMEWDESQTFPIDTFRKLGQLGMLGIRFPTEYGGSGMSNVEYSMI